MDESNLMEVAAYLYGERREDVYGLLFSKAAAARPAAHTCQELIGLKR
jgi:hypothetical protein